MIDTLVWATDGSPLADAALEEALPLAPQRIVVVYAVSYAAHADDDERRAHIDEAVERLREAVPVVDLAFRLSHDEPAQVVARVAEETGADLVVCGTRGRGTVSGAVLGSVAQQLLHLAPCPVLVVPQRSLVGGPALRR